MSKNCPLCGNIKNEDSIFCDSCKNKIEKEYEVDINTSTTDKVEHKQNLNSPTNSKIVNDAAEDPPLKTKKSNNRKSGIRITSIILLSIIIAVSSFWVFKNTIIKSNLEKSKWNEAVKENSIAGYLDYMVEFPKGKNYSIAEETLMKLKRNEAEEWKTLQVTENNAELLDFINHFPNSAYIPLIRKRIDSLTWQATLRDNTNESYKKYIELSLGGEFEGYYIDQAKERYELLTQKHPVSSLELDSIINTIDGFFVALSNINADNLEKYLAPMVYQFFNMGGGTREKIVGELIISGSKTQSPTINFIPNLKEVTYEKTLIEHYKVNVPLQKSVTVPDEASENSYGYIINIEFNPNFEIITITEKKPTY